jgi:branched-chain amino acid transport system permease protein
MAKLARQKTKNACQMAAACAAWEDTEHMVFLNTIAFIALYGLSYGLVLFMIAIGLVVTMGLMRVINMAHGVFAALGGYAALALMNTYGFPLWASIVAAVAIVALFSLPIEWLFFRRLYSASDLDQVLLTVGLAFLGIASLNLLFGPDPMPSRLPPALARSANLGFVDFQMYRIFVIVLGAALMVALWYAFERTSFGAKLRAAVDNRGMAEAIGINVRRLFSIAFALGCGLAALGGAVGYAILPLEPMYPFKYLAIILIVVAITGFGNIKSAAWVAIMVGVIDTAGRLLIPSFGAFIVYIFLIAIMMWRSQRILAR